MGSAELIIDLDHLGHNFKVLRLASLNLPSFAVIKARSYGLGAVEIAKYFEKNFPVAELPLFCLARFEEVEVLRKAGVTRDCLVMSGSHSHELYENLSQRDHLCFSSLEDLQLFASRKTSKNIVKAHLHFNTGMNRLGLSPSLLENLPEVIQLLKSCSQKGMVFEGLMSHLACAEQERVKMSDFQLKSFDKIVSALKLSWPSILGAFPKWIHLENSEGVAHDVRSSNITAIRPGLHLWGIREDTSTPRAKYELKAVACVRGRVRQIHELKSGDGIGYGLSHICSKETRSATVNLGYADGLLRQAANSSKLGLFIDGKRAPFLGRISMDLCSVDVSEMSQVKVGDWAYWICAEQPLEKIATELQTITYEMQCSLGARLVPVYKGAS
ncbi:alanine racemase [bacterium]|nr:alanine racemase [bacterium]